MDQKRHNQPKFTEPNWDVVSAQLDIAETQPVAYEFHNSLKALSGRLETVSDEHTLPDGSKKVVTDYYMEIDSKKGRISKKIDGVLGKRLKDYVEIGPVYGPLEPKPADFSEYLDRRQLKKEAGLSRAEKRELEQEHTCALARHGLAVRLNLTPQENESYGQNFSALFNTYMDNDSWRLMLTESGIKFGERLARYGYNKDMTSAGNVVTVNDHHIIASRYVQLLKLGTGSDMNLDDEIKLAERLRDDDKWKTILTKYAEGFERFIENYRLGNDGDRDATSKAAALKSKVVRRYYEALSRGLILYVDTSSPKNTARFLSDDKNWDELDSKGPRLDIAVPQYPSGNKKAFRNMSKNAKSFARYRKNARREDPAHIMPYESTTPAPLTIQIPEVLRIKTQTPSQKQLNYYARRRRNARDIIAEDTVKAEQNKERDRLFNELAEKHRVEAAKITIDNENIEIPHKKSTDKEKIPTGIMDTLVEAHNLNLISNDEAPALVRALLLSDQREEASRVAELGLSESDNLSQEEKRRSRYKSRTSVARQHIQLRTGEDLDDDDPNVKILAKALVALRHLNSMGIDISDLAKIITP